jgi:hypothetical protein
MGRIETVSSHGEIAEIFKYVGKEDNVSFETQIVIVLKCLAIECGPHGPCALVFIVHNAICVRLDVEGIFGR